MTQLATSKEDKISFPQKAAYSVGIFVNNLQAAAIPAMAFILNLGLGIDPIKVGIIAFAPRIFDALCDPLTGYLSDNTRSPWGRRRPYIFFGAIAAGFVFAGMWQLPTNNQTIFFWSFLGASILYFLSYTFFVTPLVAFGYEMTADYHERTRLHAFANTVSQIPWLLTPWFFAIMANKQMFSSKVEGARTLALCIGAAIALLGVIPAIFCREKVKPREPTASEEALKPESKSLSGHVSSFIRGFATAFRCRPFLKLCVATFLIFNGYQLGNFFTLYVLKYYVFEGDELKAGILNGRFGTLTSICSLVIIPFAGWLATRIGKRETLLLTVSLSLIGYALKWFGYNPSYPNLLLVSCPFISFGIGSLFTLTGSMISDVCDVDELESHRRREGLFAAIYWWMVKVGMALAGLLSGFLLQLSGFDVEQKAFQQVYTLQFLRVVDVGVPLITSAIAVWIITSYEITESSANDVREELEKRRGKLH